MNQQRIILLLVGVSIVLLVLIFVVGRVNVPKTQTPREFRPEALNTPVQVPFDYTVQSVDASMITLDGEKGTMRIPNNPQVVKVFLGVPPNTVEATISSLKVGQKIQLNLLPGKSATLYIVK